MKQTFLSEPKLPHNPKPYPLLKWLGAKTQLLDFITPYLRKKEWYYEPFIGGGSVFCHMFREKKVLNVHLADINKRLMNFYRVVRDYPFEFVEQMEHYRDKNNKEYYNMMQKQTSKDPITDAGIFLYLNKTSFRGLYQENLKGEFNAAYGYRKKIKYVEIDKIINLSGALQGSVLQARNYTGILKSVLPNSMVYLDPPYHKMFEDYNKERFGEQEQIELKWYCDELLKKKCMVVQSNNYTPFINELYQDWHIETIDEVYHKFSHYDYIKECMITNHQNLG